MTGQGLQTGDDDRQGLQTLDDDRQALPTADGRAIVTRSDGSSYELPNYAEYRETLCESNTSPIPILSGGRRGLPPSGKPTK